MKSKIFKYTYCFYLLVLLACCSTSTSPLEENEEGFVGSWMKPVNNGPARGWYMEFHKDRTGVFGPAIKVADKVGIEPYMSLLMKDWRVQNDTLSIQVEMRPGLVFYGPDGKEVEKNDKPSFFRYKIWQVSDTLIVLEDLIEEFPGTKDRLKKSHKLELLSE